MHRYTLSYFVDIIVVLLLFACLLYSHEYDECGRVRRITHDYDKIEEQRPSRHYCRGGANQRPQGRKVSELQTIKEIHYEDTPYRK